MRFSVQLDLPFLRARPTPPVQLPPVPGVGMDSVHFVRVRRARRYILRVGPDGGLRVTIPRGGSQAEALRFARQQAEWVARERARVRTAHAPRTWTDGSTILLRGEPVVIRVDRLERSARVTYGDRRVTVDGDSPDVRPAVERDLRALAQAEVMPRLRALAAEHGITIGRITVRNQRSRWGSCSPRGDIALNYRLVQMPAAVCEYVLLHELMHVRQQNHSVRFWRLVERVCPGFRAAERWLRTEGRALF